MSKDFYYKIHSIVENIENEEKRVREINKKQFVKTELETIQENIELAAKKDGKYMLVRYSPPDYILAKMSLIEINDVLKEELEGFFIGLTPNHNVNTNGKYFVIRFDNGAAI